MRRGRRVKRCFGHRTPRLDRRRGNGRLRRVLVVADRRLVLARRLGLDVARGQDLDLERQQPLAVTLGCRSVHVESF